jgi:hypothetical protein
MSIFNIKLKTKSGNDIKKKETFTVFFRVNFKKGLTTTAEYTYRIMSSKGVVDPKRVMELKNKNSILSIEDLTLKVMLNFCHIIGGMTQANDMNPDFILFMSPDLESKKSRAWQFLKDAFSGVTIDVPANDKDDPFDPKTPTIKEEIDFDSRWTEEMCRKYKIVKDELELLRKFKLMNPTCRFMAIDPGRDPKKYAKSIHLCNMLQDRLDRKVELWEENSVLIK